MKLFTSGFREVGAGNGKNVEGKHKFFFEKLASGEEQGELA